jgi:glyoxylase-like metal-dependent hydrolase (beta-lactamase superfamily II)
MRLPSTRSHWAPRQPIRARRHPRCWRRPPRPRFARPGRSTTTPSRSRRNVYGFFEKRLNPIVSSNIIAVIGTDAVLLFDTGHHPSITRQIAGDLRRLTDKPVRYVVISHWHDDHWAGNAEIARAYPGVQIIAHTFTAKMIESPSRQLSRRGVQERSRGFLTAAPHIERMDVARIVPGTGLSCATINICATWPRRWSRSRVRRRRRTVLE